MRNVLFANRSDDLIFLSITFDTRFAPLPLNSMKEPLHIIHVEDCADDSVLVQHLLQSNGIACDMQRVQTREDLLRALHESKCDLILSDCTLPGFHGLEALKIARAEKPEIPFIFVSGTIGEETAIKSLQDGATDYVLKHRLSRLLPSVRRALTEAEGQKARRAMEAQLRHARKLEAIGTFAGGIVHDLRNLLQLLKLNIHELPMAAHDPAQVNEIARLLNRATDQGCDMMQEILVFARKAESNLAPLDLATQIGKTTQMVLPTLPVTVKLALHLDEKFPDIMADAGQVDRILTNLIRNACDAMPMGGTITISADLVQFAPTISPLSPESQVPYLRLTVADTGMGMDEETQARIFEPFYTTKPSGKGTGLGLAVAFGLMEAHRGFIDFTSRVGEGSAFSLFFPLAADTPVAADQVHEVRPNQLLGAL
jgi:signal transduction histidine kinase